MIIIACPVRSCALIRQISMLSKPTGQAPTDRFPFNLLRRPSICHLSFTLTPPFILMSHTHPASSSSTNFQLIFSNALKAYEKLTKNDLLSHPLAVELQACQSPSSILAVLQQRVQELDQSRTNDERLAKWLEPTINVLYAFSETIGEGVSLVRPMT